MARTWSNDAVHTLASAERGIVQVAPELAMRRAHKGRSYPGWSCSSRLLEAERPCAPVRFPWQHSWRHRWRGTSRPNHHSTSPFRVGVAAAFFDPQAQGRADADVLNLLGLLQCPLHAAQGGSEGAVRFSSCGRRLRPGVPVVLGGRSGVELLRCRGRPPPDRRQLDQSPMMFRTTVPWVWPGGGNALEHSVVVAQRHCRRTDLRLACPEQTGRRARSPPGEDEP